jgi:hypothetical protein
LLDVDASSIAHIPNAKVVQKGNFLGVVAPRNGTRSRRRLS